MSEMLPCRTLSHADSNLGIKYANVCMATHTHTHTHTHTYMLIAAQAQSTPVCQAVWSQLCGSYSPACERYRNLHDAHTHTHTHTHAQHTDKHTYKHAYTIG